MDKGNKRAGASGESGKDKKRAKMMNARSIQTQYSPQSSRGSSPGPSGTLKAARSLDVENFAQARAFEINAMHTAMERSQDSAAQRAFQSLPRNLRRRAASHNIKRLPVRLRARAMREVESDPVKKGKKPANRHKKRRPGTISEEYLRRQGTKRWLETHIWHAKRMKMVEKWGYKLAEHSNEHGLRSAYKSSHHQCIIQDSSYNGCVELKGPRNQISELFKHMMDPAMPSVGSARYIDGKRQCSSFLYEYDCFPRKLFATATFLWRQDAQHTMETDVSTANGQLWVWIHPSAFDLALEKIQAAVEILQFKDSVSVQDLENSLVMFDFTGPRSTAALQAVLQPNQSDHAVPYEDAHKLWTTISYLRTSSSLPPGVTLSLLVDDPRLTFPHKPDARLASIPQEKSDNVHSVLSDWPVNVAASGLWDAGERDRLLESKATEAELNERRAQNLVPGTKLMATESDGRIPVILLQREGKPQINRAPGGGSSEFECGWTLVLPRGWGMPFWKSFIFAGARPGGLRERRSFHFETRQSCFPYDFPNTPAYDQFAEEERTESSAKYDRKPVAKRINYAKLGVEDPFGAAWIKCLKAAVSRMSGDQDTAVDLDEKAIWLMQTPRLIAAVSDSARSVASSAAQDSQKMVEALNTVLSQCLQGLFKISPAPSIEPLMIEQGLVRVGVEYLGRGTIGMNGMIYIIPAKSYKDWAGRSLLKGKRTHEGQPRYEKKAKSWVDSDSDEESDMEESDVGLDALETTRPSSNDLLGYVTTGQYSYSEGRSYGIGCCSALGLAMLIEFETRQRLLSKKKDAGSTSTLNLARVPQMLVLVRSIRSRASRLAKLTILS